MMQSRIWFSILVVVVGSFGLSIGGYAQEKGDQEIACEIAKLVELKDGKAESIRRVYEVDILKLDRERVQRGVTLLNPVHSERIVDCKSGANVALLTDSDAEVWLNYDTEVAVTLGTIELDVGQIYIEKPGATAFKLGNALSISSRLASSLNRGDIPGGLRRTLGKVGITLSAPVVVVKEEDSRWLIKDGDQKYSVRRDENNKARLNISLDVRSDGTEFFLKALDEKLLFSIGLEYQTDLDGENISERLRQEFFENSKISFSEGATVLVREEGVEWRIDDIDDEGDEQTYIIRKEEDKLNIYDEKDPAIIYLFKGRIGVGPDTLDKDNPVAAISNTGEIELFPRDDIPPNIEDNLFRARLWRNSIKGLMLPFWKKPNFYVPATALAAVGAGVTIYRYAKGKGSKDSRLNVFVDPWERRR